jgi:ABC-type xylose transport system permease subunit
MLVYGYLLIVMIATPYLPLLIQWASSRWPTGSISGFVLGVEISIGILLIFSAGAIFFCNRLRFPSFVLIIGGLIAFASLFYLIVPNPYELTHLPEYAILGVLVLRAIKGGGGRKREKVNETYIYPVRRLSSSVQRWYGRESWVWNRFKALSKPSNRVYLQSAMIISVLGTIDELYQGVLPIRYFNWRDIFLNGLGGLLGLTIFWGISREREKL